MTIEDQEQPVEEVQEDQETDSPAGVEDESQGVEAQDEEGELEISFGEKEEPEKETESETLNDLRHRHRSLKKKYRRTLHQLEQFQVTEKPIDPGPMPTLDAFDYDSDKYQEEMTKWFEKKNSSDKAKEEAKAKAEKENREQQELFQKYSERKSKLRVSDFKEAEEDVAEQLDITKQNVILKYAEKPELIVYALGKNQAKLAELAKMDPFQFAKELGKLEGSLKVGKRTPKTQPEKTISSTGTLSGTSDKTLEKLRAEAAKTGNYTKVNEYRRKKRASG